MVTVGVVTSSLLSVQVDQPIRRDWKTGVLLTSFWDERTAKDCQRLQQNQLWLEHLATYVKKTALTQQLIQSSIETIFHRDDSHCPLAHLSTASHLQAMSADVQVSARSGASVLSQTVRSGVHTSWPISVAHSRQILLVFSTHPDSDSRTASILLVWSCIVELAAGTPSGPGAQSQRVPWALEDSDVCCLTLLYVYCLGL